MQLLRKTQPRFFSLNSLSISRALFCIAIGKLVTHPRLPAKVCSYVATTQICSRCNHAIVKILLPYRFLRRSGSLRRFQWKLHFDQTTRQEAFDPVSGCKYLSFVNRTTTTKGEEWLSVTTLTIELFRGVPGWEREVGEPAFSFPQTTKKTRRKTKLIFYHFYYLFCIDVPWTCTYFKEITISAYTSSEGFVLSNHDAK